MEFEAQRLCDIMSQRLASVASQVGAGMPEAVLLQAQANSLAATFASSTAINLQVATQATHRINSGRWAPDQKSLLATALNDAASATELQKRSGAPRCQQARPDLQFFRTAPDWNSMVDPMLPEAAKACALATRTWRPGITCPNEKTQMAAAAIALTCHYSDVATADAEKRRFIADKVQSKIKELDKAKVDVTKITMVHRRSATEFKGKASSKPSTPSPASSSDQPQCLQLALPPSAPRPQQPTCPLQLLAGLATQAFGNGAADALAPLMQQFGMQFQQQHFQRANMLPYSSTHLPPAQALADAPRDGAGAAAAAVGAGGIPHTAPTQSKTADADDGDEAATPDDELEALESSMLAVAKAKKKGGAE
ncbi:unnamed protein product, partial [Prorocentrum cordatum]